MLEKYYFDGNLLERAALHNAQQFYLSGGGAACVAATYICKKYTTLQPTFASVREPNASFLLYACTGCAKMEIFCYPQRLDPAGLADNEFPLFYGKNTRDKGVQNVLSSLPFKISRKIYVYTSRRIIKYSRITSRGKRCVYTSTSFRFRTRRIL